VTKEEEHYVNESSFIGNSTALIYIFTLLVLINDANRWSFGAFTEL